MNRILILKTGVTAETVLRVHGDYDRWFTDAMAPHGLTFQIIDVTHEAIPALDDFIGIIVTGSASSACRHEPWMGPVMDFLRDAGTTGLPLLGVCLGAQILAQARGGRVILNPEGWEIGGVTIARAPGASGDPLFENLPPAFGALATHEDRIEELPQGAVLLASNASTPVQAFRIGARIWGTQFHPEATAQILRKLIILRADQLARDTASHGRDPDRGIEPLLATLHRPDIDQGRTVLDNFVRVCLQEARQGKSEQESQRGRSPAASPRP